ncbi:extracellular solute-binding protein [Paenibacillus sp. J5C_2022]|uniref:ABC transporter substrate-binding protein n=1 Tax=Paenibacillus sp. J5C2022 TaxID=2977129 RepID=UPI0021D19BEB|nr:extracellular solute-binding protein [Paenibacillus sp. J5C2022]MCU6711152.1 extracellular solute-binding protein [Paenibacillus sp. J5C2022]
MKKWFIGVLAMVMLVSVAAGCSSVTGNGSDDVNGNGGKEGQSSTGKESEKGQVTIKLHHWYNDKQDHWDEVIAAFEEEFPHIRVESVTAGDNNSNEMLKKVDLAAASGDGMDIIMVNNHENYAQRVGLGMFEPLNAYMEKESLNYEEVYKVGTDIEGQYYALPGKFNQFFIMINKDKLDKANLPIPTDWTWDDYLAYAKAMTEGEGASKQYGTYFHSWSDYVKLALFSQPQNSNLVKDDGESSNGDNPLLRKSLEIRHQAQEVDGSATPYMDVITQKLNYRTQYFGQSAAMIMTGSWMVPEAGGTDKIPAEFQTVFAPYPKNNESDKLYTRVSSDLMAIYAKSKHKDEAYQFIRWYTTEGITMQGKYLPSWKQADMKQVVDTLVNSSKNPEMVHKESLISVLENAIPAPISAPVPFIGEVEKAYLEETDKFLLGEQDIDTTLEQAQEKIEKIIKANTN